MDVGRMIAIEKARRSNKSKIIPKSVMDNISPDIEWLKWLSYESEFEKKRIEYFDSKKVSELSYEELEEASRYSRNKVFSRLFKIYGTDECSEEDHMRVYDYMCNESIEELMLSKLSSEELQYAKQEITSLSIAPTEQLRAMVSDMQKPEIYEQLSMVNSYILHIISDINFVRNLSDLERKIEAQVEQNKQTGKQKLYSPVASTRK